MSENTFHLALQIAQRLYDMFGNGTNAELTAPEGGHAEKDEEEDEEEESSSSPKRHGDADMLRKASHSRKVTKTLENLLSRVMMKGNSSVMTFKTESLDAEVSTRKSQRRLQEC